MGENSIPVPEICRPTHTQRTIHNAECTVLSAQHICHLDIRVIQGFGKISLHFNTVEENHWTNGNVGKHRSKKHNFSGMHQVGDRPACSPGPHRTACYYILLGRSFSIAYRHGLPRSKEKHGRKLCVKVSQNISRLFWNQCLDVSKNHNMVSTYRYT